MRKKTKAKETLISYVEKELNHRVRQIILKQHKSGYVNFPILGGGSFKALVCHDNGWDTYFLKRESDYPKLKTFFHRIIGKSPKLISTEAQNLFLLNSIGISPYLYAYYEGMLIAEYIEGESVLTYLNNGQEEIVPYIETLGKQYAKLHNIGITGRDYRINEHMIVYDNRIVVLDWGTRTPLEKSRPLDKQTAQTNLNELQVTLHYEFKNGNAQFFWNHFIDGYNTIAQTLEIDTQDRDFSPNISLENQLYYEAIVRIKKGFYSCLI